MKVVIVGMKFRPYFDRIECIKSDDYKFEVEPDNNYDKNAIKILFHKDDRWIHFGYVSRDYNESNLLKNKIINDNYKISIREYNHNHIILTVK